jgi:UDP-3-O-[3-hydroxymyristoyl] glucosamine N-acyltransferase
MCDSEISPEAKIGRRVQIGHGARVYPWARIEDGTVIGDYCIIGHPTGEARGETVIGPGSTVRSHTVIYRDVETGPQFQTGHHALVRDGTRAGVNLRMGSYSDIEGACTIGDYCRLHGFTHVGRGSRIGHFVWIFSSTILLNDPLPPSHIERPVVLEDGVVVCAAALVMPGAILRQGAFITAGAHAHGDVPAGAVVEGLRGQVISHVALLANLEAGTCHPWMRHFAGAYPPEAQERIESLLAGILASRRPSPRA